MYKINYRSGRLIEATFLGLVTMIYGTPLVRAAEIKVKATFENTKTPEYLGYGL